MVIEDSPHKDLMFRMKYCLQDLKDLADLEMVSSGNRERIAGISADGMVMYGVLVGAHEKGAEVPESVLVSIDQWCDFVEGMIGRLATAAGY